jgi:predicted anti-sigma-YlaC factor YlaD
LLHRDRANLREALATEMKKALAVLSLRDRYLVCQQAIELLTDYLEGSLSRRQRIRLERHLRGCPNCSNYLEQIRLTVRLTGAIAPEEMAPDAVEDLTQLYRRWRDVRSSRIVKQYRPG